MGFVRQNTETDAPTSRVSPTGPRLMRSDEGCQRIACNIKNMKQKGTNWLCSYKSIPTRRNAQSRTITHNPPNLNRLCYDTSMNPASGPTPR
jgi:ribosomal 30S subunit maturation factor RimM